MEIADSLEKLRASPLGVPGAVTESGGLMFHSLSTSGYIGGVLMLWTMWEYFNRLVFISWDRKYFVFSVAMYGTLVQALVFTSGGITSPAGFLVLALVLTRLRELTKRRDAIVEAVRP